LDVREINKKLSYVSIIVLVIYIPLVMYKAVDLIYTVIPISIAIVDFLIHLHLIRRK